MSTRSDFGGTSKYSWTNWWSMDWSRSARARVSRFFRLSKPERRVLFESAFLLPVTVVVQSLVGFARCRALLERLVSWFEASSPDRSDLAAVANETARVFAWAARTCPCRTSCLHRSLVLWWILRRRGIASRLWIGVHKEAGRIEAHAWVECLGVVVGDGESIHQRFTPFPSPILS
jgi:hypothetical protein